MIREKAFKLAGEVADSGFSCAVHITALRKSDQHEYCSVTVKALRLDGPQIQALGAIGETHGCDLNLITGDGLTFFEKAGGS